MFLRREVSCVGTKRRPHIPSRRRLPGDQKDLSDPTGTDLVQICFRCPGRGGWNRQEGEPSEELHPEWAAGGAEGASSSVRHSKGPCLHMRVGAGLVCKRLGSFGVRSKTPQGSGSAEAGHVRVRAARFCGTVVALHSVGMEARNSVP